MYTVYSDTLHWDAGEVLEAGKDSKQEVFGPKFTLTFRCVTCLTLRGLSIKFCISFPDFIYGTRWTRWTRCPAWPISQVGSRYLERLERAGENLFPLWCQSAKSSHRDFPKSFFVIDSVLHIHFTHFSLRKNMFGNVTLKSRLFERAASDSPHALHRRRLRPATCHPSGRVSRNWNHLTSLSTFQHLIEFDSWDCDSCISETLLKDNCILCLHCLHPIESRFGTQHRLSLMKLRCFNCDGRDLGALSVVFDILLHMFSILTYFFVCRSFPQTVCCCLNAFLVSPSWLECCVRLCGLAFLLSPVMSLILSSSWFGMPCPCSGLVPKISCDFFLLRTAGTALTCSHGLGLSFVWQSPSSRIQSSFWLGFGAGTFFWCFFRKASAVRVLYLKDSASVLSFCTLLCFNCWLLIQLIVVLPGLCRLFAAHLTLCDTPIQLLGLCLWTFGQARNLPNKYNQQMLLDELNGAGQPSTELTAFHNNRCEPKAFSIVLFFSCSFYITKTILHWIESLDQMW